MHRLNFNQTGVHHRKSRIGVHCSKFFSCTTGLILVFFSVVLLARENVENNTAGRITKLDEYVKKANPDYQYKVLSRKQEDGYSVVMMDMTSGTWLSKELVDPTLWQHQLITVIPENLKFKKSLIWIGGGSNDKKRKTSPSSRLLAIAMKTQSMVTEIRMIPNI